MKTTKFDFEQILAPIEELSPRAREMIDHVLADDRFFVWPASCTSRSGGPKHHGEMGGLARHTLEVLDLALAAASAASCVGKVDISTLAVGAVWHDYGKVLEYTLENTDNPETFVAIRSDEAFLLSHICHGMLTLGRLCGGFCDLKHAAFHKGVAHLVASHHGRKEWGSPVVPQTAEALLLHQADMMSVMLETNSNPESRM